jgi:hypothetical protein
VMRTKSPKQLTVEHEPSTYDPAAELRRIMESPQDIHVTFPPEEYTVLDITGRGYFYLSKCSPPTAENGWNWEAEYSMKWIEGPMYRYSWWQINTLEEPLTQS